MSTSEAEAARASGAPLHLPAILVSYVYLDLFRERRIRFRFRDWALDSGAFSAFNAGTEVDLEEYIDVALRAQSEDPSLVEVFALDDIGDWRVTLRNCERMRKAGLRVIPTYHYGEPERVLEQISEEYPKIALGGVAKGVRKGERIRWFGECFSRVWPKQVHGFGVFDPDVFAALPWHSFDATSWEVGPCAFGMWKSYGGQRVSIRGSDQPLRVEVEFYMGLERENRERWAREMESIGSPEGPTMRFVQVSARAYSVMEKMFPAGGAS